MIFNEKWNDINKTDINDINKNDINKFIIV